MPSAAHMRRADDAGAGAAVDAANPYHDEITFISVFLAEQALGFIFLSAVLITVVLSPRVRRNGPWISFLVSCMLYSLSYLLLAFAGQQTGPQPDFGLCLAQAVLTYGSPPLAAFASLSLILQLWFDLSVASKKQLHPLRTAALIVSPYIVYVLVLLEALGLGLRDKDQVMRLPSDAYCCIHTGVPGRISSALVALALLAAIVFQVLTGLALRRSHAALQGTHARAPLRSMMVRVGLFTLVVLASVAISIVSFTHAAETEVPNAAMGAMPLLAFLIFGTQRDIFRAWMFWKHEEPMSSRSSVVSVKSKGKGEV